MTTANTTNTTNATNINANASTSTSTSSSTRTNVCHDVHTCNIYSTASTEMPYHRHWL